MSSTAGGAALLRGEKLCKLYPDGEVHAVEDVDISIRRGEYVAIMGPSGSGKSTLLNLLGALDRPTAGEVYFEETPFSRLGSLDRFRSQKLGFVFQSFYLLPVLTAAENVQVPMFETPWGPEQRAARAAELLNTVGLSHRVRHMPNQLSIGERQRVAVARALANEPILLLADEPTGNLDSKAAAGIFDLFDHLHQERGVTIVLITHDEGFAHRAKRLVRMRDGKIVSDESS
jgi:putative ABC transport system ATP-binding protein